MGMLRLGLCLETGFGCKQNPAQALQYYRKAADTGLAQAQRIYAHNFYYGQCGVSRDYDTAFAWYSKAAGGDADAQYHLGSCFLLGRGTPADINRALHWLRAAADQNFAPALCALGRCLEDGQGLPADLDQAVECYRKAADQEFGPALSALGRLYDTGALPSSQPDAALECYRRAAEAREPEAMLWMATHYAMEEDGLAKAADLCHQALELLPPDSPLAETANQLLERLEGDFFV